MAIKDFEDVMDRVNKIAIDPELSGAENTQRCLSLGMAAMRAFQDNGIEAAKSMLTAATIAKQHKASGLEI